MAPSLIAIVTLPLYVSICAHFLKLKPEGYHLVTLAIAGNVIRILFALFIYWGLISPSLSYWITVILGIELLAFFIVYLPKFSLKDHHSQNNRAVENQESTPQRPANIDQTKLYQEERISSLGTLTNGLAHELNNPLAIIAGHQYRLNAMITSNNINISDFKTSLTKIGRAVKRVLSIIDALKAYSQDDSGKLELAEANIRETIQFALDLCRERLNSLGINLTTQPIPDTFVRCNQGQIMQVLLILIDNSIDATTKQDQKNISIEYKQTVTDISVSVIDNGPEFLLQCKAKCLILSLQQNHRTKEKAWGLVLLRESLLIMMEKYFKTQTTPKQNLSLN